MRRIAMTICLFLTVISYFLLFTLSQNMIIIYILLGLIIVLLVCLLIIVISKRTAQPADDLKYKLEHLVTEVNRIESSVKNEFFINRGDLGNSQKNLREELSRELKAFSTNLTALTRSIEYINQTGTDA